MKIAVEKNALYCPDVNSRIHHMECNDECRHFCGCAIVDQSFVVECAWSKQTDVLPLQKQPVAENVQVMQPEGAFTA